MIYDSSFSLIKDGETFINTAWRDVPSIKLAKRKRE